MLLSKFHRLGLAVAATMMGLTLVQTPSLWAAPLGQQAGLAWLPLLVPLLVGGLGFRVTRRSADDYLNFTTSWIGVIRWAILLPVLVTYWLPDSGLQLNIMLVTAAAVGLWWALLIPQRGLIPTLAAVDEPWFDLVFEPQTKHSPALSLTIVAAAWLRLSNFNISPALGGYGLLAGVNRPLWATGAGAIIASAYRRWFEVGTRPYIQSIVLSHYLIFLAIPIICWLAIAYLRYSAYPRQLSLKFDEPRRGVLFLVGGLLLGLGIMKEELGRLVLAAVIASFYALLAKSTVGLVLFPAWAFLQMSPREVWPWLTAGTLAAIVCASLSGEMWSARRKGIAPVPSLSWITVIVTLIIAVIIAAIPQLRSELATFPSRGGDWLAQLTGGRLSPFLWVWYLILLSVGILFQQPVYIYVAWGLLLPSSWGWALLVGSGLSRLTVRQKDLQRVGGKGLLVGDILASLLLLIN